MKGLTRSTIRKSLAVGAVAAVSAIVAPAFASAPAAGIPAPGTYALKDGNTLAVAGNGWMRMFSPEGKRVHMRDGVAMETRDGKVIAMKEDPNWKQLRQFGTLSPKSR